MVTGLADGGFVVIWEQGSEWNPWANLRASVDAEGGAITIVDSNRLRLPRWHVPQLTELPDGGFVVVWTGWDNSGYGVYGQRYDAYWHSAGFSVSSQLQRTITTSRTLRSRPCRWWVCCDLDE